MKSDWVLNDDAFPALEGTKKFYYAKAIIEARKKQLMASDPSWESMTKEMLKDEIEKRNEAARSEIQERLANVRVSNFFHLCVEGSGLRERYSERHVLFQQPNQQGGGTGRAAPTPGRSSFINAMMNRSS